MTITPIAKLAHMTGYSEEQIEAFVAKDRVLGCMDILYDQLHGPQGECDKNPTNEDYIDTLAAMYDFNERELNSLGSVFKTLAKVGSGGHPYLALTIAFHMGLSLERQQTSPYTLADHAEWVDKVGPAHEDHPEHAEYLEKQKRLQEEETCTLMAHMLGLEGENLNTTDGIRIALRQKLIDNGVSEERADMVVLTMPDLAEVPAEQALMAFAEFLSSASITTSMLPRRNGNGADDFPEDESPDDPDIPRGMENVRRTSQGD